MSLILKRRISTGGIESVNVSQTCSLTYHKFFKHFG